MALKAGPRHLLDFVLREWILSAALAGAVVTTLVTVAPPPLGWRDAEVLFVLWCLFVAVRGLHRQGVVAFVSRRFAAGGRLPVRVVLSTFLLSMLVTNDVALLVIVPLVLATDVPRKGGLVILAALAANAGSALTPFGNPQNLFIYWFYDLTPLAFMTAIVPFSLAFLLLLLLPAWAMGRCPASGMKPRPPLAPVSALWHGAGFLAVLLAVLHLVPVGWVGLAPLLALWRDRAALRVDYVLLATFLLFFVVAENLRLMLASTLVHPDHVFLLSALASQVMSNVPAALLFARFTDDWPALLWGTSVGGFGSLFASLANLIAYRLYLAAPGTRDGGRFTRRFLLAGFAAFLAGVALYLLLPGPGR